MKKIFLPFAAILMSVSLFAQNFTITGTVTETGSGNPVANHPVYISADSTVLNYYNTVYTDANGDYSDVIPNGAQIGPNIMYFVYTPECNGGWQTATTSNQQGTVQSAVIDFQICTGNGGGNPPCNATFGYIDSAGTGSVYFFPSSTQGGYSYAWDFGDGNTSTQMYPVHNYAAPGNYTVCLALIDSLQNVVCTYCMTVTAGSGCNAYFSWYADTTNSVIYLYNNSWNQNASYFWDFGDGNTSTQMFPTHTYANSGSYVVCLTVTDNNFFSCTATWCDTITYVQFAGGQNRNGFTINVIAPGSNPSGVEEMQLLSGVSLYPNPADENATLEFESSISTNASYVITDMLGKIVVSTPVNVSAGANRISLNTASLDHGFYMVTLADANGKTTSVKLIKR